MDNIGGKLSSNGIYYTDAEGQINISGITGTLIFTEVSSIHCYGTYNMQGNYKIVFKTNLTCRTLPLPLLGWPPMSMSSSL